MKRAARDATVDVDVTGRDVAGGLTRSTLLLMATATGLSVAGNYFAQPLLDTMAQRFGMSSGTAALVVTVSQLGYVCGLVLLVPLGDLLERRRLTVTLCAATAVGLAWTAAAPNVPLLFAGLALTGLCSVGAQVMVPFAATMASPEMRGRAVGTVMTGLLLGILLARTAAGGLAELGGWRTVYWVNAVLMLAMALLLRRILPLFPAAGRASYLAAFRSMALLLRDHPVLRWRTLTGASGFGAFTVLWVSLTFLLSGPPYGWSTAAIGLMGLAGAAGAAAASAAGRLADRGLVHTVTIGGAILLLASWAVLLAGGRHGLAWLLAGVLVLDLAVQAVHISNQNVVYALDPPARSRLNSLYMTAYFLGGVAGSALTSLVWAHAGWTGACALGAAFSAAALLSCLGEMLGRRAATV
ncbi:MFS transporter [Streptomyces sp. NPDC088116]|uniref:MFS transporter n=1 Tax=Streptomyces sp. NPDC088116 TaxID=3365825 RepID=UPI00381F0751